jgi:hypothetical protein
MRGWTGRFPAKSFHFVAISYRKRVTTQYWYVNREYHFCLCLRWGADADTDRLAGSDDRVHFQVGSAGVFFACSRARRIGTKQLLVT